jgi:hypothetical protein
VLYARLLCHDESLTVGTDADQVAAFEAFAAKLGTRLAGNALLLNDPGGDFSDRARRDGNHRRRSVFRDGRQIAGFSVVECAHWDEAIDSGVFDPRAGFERVEIRPIWEIV